MITVRSVVAHTECGPFDEHGEVELPPDSVKRTQNTVAHTA